MKNIDGCKNSSSTGQTFNVANRPNTYKSMGMKGGKVVHKSGRCRVPERARVFETKNVVLYSLEITLVAHEYELLHVVDPERNRFGSIILQRAILNR